ncbi:hypothetical protein PMAYCL1PPCAC_04384, partial [Pristionchus mayeri]
RPSLIYIPLGMRPVSGEMCFGLPIDYSHVPATEVLPVEYEVLRRFPKCWSVLGPMLCGVIYRPCHVGNFITKYQSKDQTMETWQRFPVDMCKRVHELCEDGGQLGLFPSELIDCSRTAENRTWLKEKENHNGSLARLVPSGDEEALKNERERRTLFSESCPLPYDKNASRPEPMQCIFPLVYTSHDHIPPVFDQCYLPCRNPLISSSAGFLSFRLIRACMCFVLAAVCIAIFCFLSSRSSTVLNDDVTFAIACCLLSFAAYLIVWGTGSINFLAQASECTIAEHGIAIRNTLLDSKWCLLTFFVSHVSLASSIGFLAAAYALNAACATKADALDNKKEKQSVIK